MQRFTSSSFLLELGRFSLFQIPFDALEPTLCDAEVGEYQFILHRLRVSRRIHRTARMGDRRITERADDVNERVGVLVRGHVDESLRAGAWRGDRDR